jgi:SAM-dependent methyltransferase
MDLRAEYDAWHQRRHDADRGHDDGSEPWHQLVSEYLGDVAGLRVLELACGRGGFTHRMARGGAAVTGCDFSLSALQIASGKFPVAQDPSDTWFVQADGQSLPFADNSFDLIVSCETIEHLPDVRSAIREMYRVTRPQGRLLLTTPNYFNFMGLYEVYAHFRHPKRRDDQPFDRRQWFFQIQRWIRSAGWSVLHTDGTVHQFPIVPGRNPIHWRSLESSRVIRKLLCPFALTYFVAAQKPSSSSSAD